MKKTGQGGIVLPEWVPVEAWEGFVAMRKQIKKPLTERAMVVALNKLEKLRAEGQDPEAVLDQSTFACWQGLFPVKEQRRAAEPPKEEKKRPWWSVGCR